jgi:hypothetical protein
MLEQPQDGYEDLDAVLEAGADPFYGPITADEEADPEDEALLGQVMHELGTMMYKEGGTNEIVNMINASDQELFAIVPEVAAPLIQKGYEIANQIDPEGAAIVTFGEEGIVHQVNDMIFELAAQMGHPDAQDQEQYMAALTGIYSKVGQHMQETGDTAGLEELGKVATEMTLNTPEGAAAAKSAPPQQQALPQEIQGILGTGGGM